jgi:hypothetical protein
MIGDLGDHVFIGYKMMPENNYMPIIIPKKYPMTKFNPTNLFVDYSNGLSSIMMTYTGPTDISHNDIKERARKYTIYLPYLNQLTNIEKINIYDAMNKGIILVDDDNSIINLMFHHLDSHVVNLQNLKDKSKHHYNVTDIILQNMYGHRILRPLMQNIYYKKMMNCTDPIDLSYNIYKRSYGASVRETETILLNYPLLKELIQDLEYRYQGIIEPILLTDETSIYNYANGLEATQPERTDRMSQVLEEGMKKI